MHFYNLIKEFENEEIILFVDMDGVIAAYEVGNPFDFKNKRPLMDNIRKIDEVGKFPNVELHILSVCRKDFQVDEKNEWLDKNAPFFKKENRTIISKEKMCVVTSAELKANFLKNLDTKKKVILVDDDNLVLKKVMEEAKNVIVFQDSELVD